MNAHSMIFEMQLIFPEKKILVKSYTKTIILWISILIITVLSFNKKKIYENNCTIKIINNYFMFISNNIYIVSIT